MEKVKELPFTSLSKLLRDALADLRLCEAEPDLYQVNMFSWMQPFDRDALKSGDIGKCYVCLAGATMANRLDLSLLREKIAADRESHGDEYDQGEFTPHDLVKIPQYGRTWRYLRALNCIREGAIGDAIRFAYGKESHDEIGICSLRHSDHPMIRVAEYRGQNSRFYDDMENVAVHLEAMGL